MLLPLFFGRLSDLPLPTSDELTHAATGKEILVTRATGSLCTRTARRSDHVAALLLARGRPLLADRRLRIRARFPAALSGYLCAILIYLLTRRLFGRRTAFLSILVTATSILFIKYSRRAMIDVPAAFAITLGAYALVRAEKRNPFFLLYGLAIALGYYFKAVQGLYLALIGRRTCSSPGNGAGSLNPWFLAANVGAVGLIALWVIPSGAGQRRRVHRIAIGARPGAQPGADRRPRAVVHAFSLARTGSFGPGYRCRLSG